MPGEPVVESIFQRREHKIDPCSETKIPHAEGQLRPLTTVEILLAATKTYHSQIDK